MQKMFLKGDYHADMNGTKFEKWWTEQLKQNLKPESVIVLDNVPYHTVIEAKYPTTANKKAHIIEYHGIDIPEANPH